MNFYRITKVRLVNFHNFVNETIDVRDGGHLFMLGDNGSGKTTVLDAIHYVLTAGESMEFNSAARVAGAKQGGRSIHGVVLRYNIEKGALNPSGGTTYAALEIAGRNNRPVSICIGVSTHSMEESVERWGVIKECPVSELPLTHEKNGKTCVTTMNELKQAVGATNFYRQIGSYAEELASRFFSDRETFRDVCKFLATGKAYREIASKTSDYHLLFRELLQEPPRDVFEEVITQLKSLEESRQDLDKLRNKFGYVQTLDKLQSTVQEARIDVAAIRWQERNLAAREYQAGYDIAMEHCSAEEHRLADLTEDAKRLKNILEADELRLSELRHKDADGLVFKERGAANLSERAYDNHEQSKRKLVIAQQAHEESTEKLLAAREGLCKQSQHFMRSLQSSGRGLPFSTSALSSVLEDAQKSDIPEQDLAELPILELRTNADELMQTVSRQLALTEERREGLLRRRAVIEADMKERQLRGEATPLVKGFSQAQRLLQQRMINAFSLYEKLVPASGVSLRELAALEQLLGDAVLATWVTDAASANDVRSLIFREFPEQGLAVVSENTHPIHLDWLKSYFNVKDSDEKALIALQHILNDKYGPHVEPFLNASILRFRLREQLRQDAPPRLLGAEVRRREGERELRALEKQLGQLEKELKEATAEQNELLDQQCKLTHLRTLLHEIVQDIGRLRDGVLKTAHDEAIRKNDHVNARADCMQREEELQIAKEAHADILLAMRKAGIEGLQEMLRELEKRISKRKTEYDKDIEETGVIKQRIANFKQVCTKALADQADALASRNTYQEALLALVMPKVTLNEFILARCATGRDAGSASIADSRCALLTTADAQSQSALITSEKIRNTVIQNEGIAFGFVYDEPTNALTDRRGRILAEVLQDTSRLLQEQEELINEQTLKLFRQLVMDNLVGALQRHVLRLNEMSRRIGKLLKDRTFGNNRYAFTITPVENRKRLYDLICNYRALDREQTEDDLRAFIEDHADEIKNTEVGSIPAVLDYRNWFRYELKVLTTDEQGVVMDRKVKSIGSGGEQAVPNYLLVLTIAHFLFDKDRIRLPVLIFDEAFYGIDAGRRDQILGFASALELQLFVASPDQDGVKKEIPFSTSIFVKKDINCDVHLYPYHWNAAPKQLDMLDTTDNAPKPIAFGEEL
jgi:energy-coupling factor transporter ATP-binding protein EcfA2